MLAAAPAMADDWDWNDNHGDSCRSWGFWVCDDDFDHDRFDDHGFFFGGDGFGDFDQEAECGDVNQSFDVSGTGDNSNQTVGTQGVTNTGNTQNQIGIIQFGSDVDDFEFDDVGSSIEVSPTNTTSSDQQVNQSASASD
jgi:hypothetical protein